jgi:hypothetical protein
MDEKRREEIERKDAILEKAGYWKFGFHTHSQRLYETFIKAIDLTEKAVREEISDFIEEESRTSPKEYKYRIHLIACEVRRKFGVDF